MSAPDTGGLKYAPSLPSSGLVLGVGYCPQKGALFPESLLEAPLVTERELGVMPLTDNAPVPLQTCPQAHSQLCFASSEWPDGPAAVCSVEMWLLFWSHPLILLNSLSLKLLNVCSRLRMR